jgi:hypothetical protein
MNDESLGPGLYTAAPLSDASKDLLQDLLLVAFFSLMLIWARKAAALPDPALVGLGRTLMATLLAGASLRLPIGLARTGQEQLAQAFLPLSSATLLLNQALQLPALAFALALIAVLAFGRKMRLAR